MYAVAHLDGMALSGSLPGDITLEAKGIAAGCWWDAHGDLAADRPVLLMADAQERVGPAMLVDAGPPHSRMRASA